MTSNKCIFTVFPLAKNVIFISILAGALIRRAGDGERRRASLGAGMPSTLRPGESTFDPNHAAILFRDSRGVSFLLFLRTICIRE